MVQLSSVVAKANAVLEVLYERTKLRDFAPFGGGMLLLDDREIVSSTIAHRIISKFQRPDDSVTESLKAACNSDWLAFENNLKSHDFYRFPAAARAVSYKARILIQEWFDAYDDPRAVYDVEFTPGETFQSNRGRVSIFQKLRRRDNWTVTHDAADDFIRLCYNNLSLKRCARKHMVRLSSVEYRRLYALFSNERHVGFSIFRHRMYSEVLTLVHGSRSSSVYKSNEKRRFINVEALGNIILQRQDAARLRHILDCVGNCLTDGQQRHMAMIADPRKATVDFSNASDSTLLRYCKFMLPSSIMKPLDRHRSPFVLIDDVYYVPEKISSMGNGFTFEVMSLLLLALARTLDPRASVYGDDVILDNEVAHEFVAAAQAAGYVVNQKKTFINSRFRESCGAFFLDDYGYITCFDIKWCHSMQHVIKTANKLTRILRDLHIRTEIYAVLEECRTSLLRLIPASFKGPLSSSRDIPDYVEDDGYVRAHRSCAETRKTHAILTNRYGCVFVSYGYASKDFVFVTLMRDVKTLASRSLRRLPHQGAKYASYLYSGRVCDDVIRTNESTEEPILVAIHRDGLILPVKELKRIRRTWRHESAPTPDSCESINLT